MTKLKSPRPRLRGARHQYEPLNLTEFIHALHAGSTAMQYKPATKGAFGGCTKSERARRRVIKDANPAGSPVVV